LIWFVHLVSGLFTTPAGAGLDGDTLVGCTAEVPVAAGAGALLVVGCGELPDVAELIVKVPEQPASAITSTPMPAAPTMIRLIFTIVPRFGLRAMRFTRLDVRDTRRLRVPPPGRVYRRDMQRTQWLR